MIFIVTGADKLLAEFLAPFKVSHLLSKVVPLVKTGPPKQLMIFFCSWVVISRNNLLCGYLVLPDLAGTQEDAESTGEGIVERRRLNRLVFSKGLEIDEAQISGKVQAYICSQIDFLTLLNNSTSQVKNQTAVKSHGFKSLNFCILLKRVMGRETLSYF